MTLKKSNHHDPMERLKADLAYWQRQLRIENMDIRLRWLAEDEDNEAMAKNFPQKNNHNVMIAIRQEIPPSWAKEFSNDLEVSLVHELLHIRDYGWSHEEQMESVFEHNDLINTHHEIAVDAIAEALVRARRGIKR